MDTLRAPLAATGVVKKSNPNSTTDDKPTPDSQERHSQQSRQYLQPEAEQQQPEHKLHQAEAFSKQEERNGYDGQDGENRLFSTTTTTTTTTMPRESDSLPSQRHTNKSRRMRQQLMLDVAKRKRGSSTVPVAPHHHRRQRNRSGPGHFYVASMHGTADEGVDIYSGYNDSDNNCSPVQTQPSPTAAIIAGVASKKYRVNKFQTPLLARPSLLSANMNIGIPTTWMNMPLVRIITRIVGANTVVQETFGFWDGNVVEIVVDRTFPSNELFTRYISSLQVGDRIFVKGELHIVGLKATLLVQQMRNIDASSSGGVSSDGAGSGGSGSGGAGSGGAGSGGAGSGGGSLSGGRHLRWV